VAQSFGTGTNEYTVEDLQRRGWCTVCGRLGCNTTLPSHGAGSAGPVEYDPEQSRDVWLEQLKRMGRMRFMVIDCQTLGVMAKELTLAHATARMIGLNGYTALITGSWRSANVVVMKGRQRIAVAGVIDPDATPAQRFSMVFAQFTRGEVFESRYRVISDDFYRMALHRVAAVGLKP
jgi:hypothetical protein